MFIVLVYFLLTHLGEWLNTNVLRIPDPGSDSSLHMYDANISGSFAAHAFVADNIAYDSDAKVGQTEHCSRRASIHH